MKTFLLTSALFVTLAACSSKKAVTTTAPLPPADPVVLGAQKFPGYTHADYTQGKSIYEGHCGNCHNLKNPSSRDEKEWRHEVADMAPKANRKAGSLVIGDKEQELIVRYLVSAGSAANQGK